MSESAGSRGGPIRAKNIQADNVVSGTQIQGADPETVRALSPLAEHLQGGAIEAERIVAGNLVSGLQYLGQGGSTPTREQWQQELAALRAQLAEAVKAGEIPDAYQAQDAQQAIARAIEQSHAPEPVATRITTQLEKAGAILETVATTTVQATENAEKIIVKLAPVLRWLGSLVEKLFA